MSEFGRNGLHGALETPLMHCTMEPDSAYVQVSVVRGHEQGRLPRRVRLPGVHGSEDSICPIYLLPDPPLVQLQA